MGKSNRYKATAVLVAAAAGAVAATMLGWPLMAHAFIAATIGGLADWFAVTALFRKPLGVVGWRTDILRRHRGRIMGALVAFLSDDLLSAANIMATLRGYDFAAMLAEYFERRGGLERVLGVARGAVAAAGVGGVPALMAPTVERELTATDVAAPLKSALATLNSGAERCRFVDTLLPLLRSAIGDPGVRSEIVRRVRAVKDAYIGGNGKRRVAVELLGVTDEELAAEISRKVTEWLSAEKLDAMLPNLVELLPGDMALPKVRLPLTIPSATPSEWALPLEETLEKYLGQFSRSAEQRAKFNEWVLRECETVLTARHAGIASLMNERLSAMSDDELVDFVESRVADDLQMIRINGSLVGGLVGLLLGVLTSL